MLENKNEKGSNKISFNETTEYFILEDGEKLSKDEYRYDQKSGYILLKGLKVVDFK
jgi:hypothetical protein